MKHQQTKLTSKATIGKSKGSVAGSNHQNKKSGSNVSSAVRSAKTRTYRRGQDDKRREEHDEETKVHERRRIMLDRSQAKLIHSFHGESKEIKEIVDTQVKSPLKRRATIQNPTSLFLEKKKIEQEDIDERLENLKRIEESKTKKLEWRAQYNPLIEVEARREKSEVKKIEGDLVRVVHTEETESQIMPRLRETFWEKIGFKDKKKVERNLVEAKEKIDVCFKRLKFTVEKNYDDKMQLEENRQIIKEQQKKKEMLEKLLQKQKQTLLLQEQAIIDAQSLLEQTQQENAQKIDVKKQEVKIAQQDLDKTKEFLTQEQELAMMRLEDKVGKYFRICEFAENELLKNTELHREKVQSQVLNEEEHQINVQLSSSKPLVTEIMEYFNRKESESAKESKIETLVEALQMAIEECLIAEAKFQKAAYYDAQKFLPFERTQRSAYTDKVKFNQ